MQKVALVTGAAAGIGRACSLRLAKEGLAVGVLDLDEARCADTVKEIRVAGGKSIALGADITNRAQVQVALAKLRAALGPVTVLVNNAGMAEFIPFEELTDALWDRMFAVNVRGTFVVTQEVIADMKAAKWGGSSTSRRRVRKPAPRCRCTTRRPRARSSR
jgi:2-hydroxycyclohexanecarboxyl-CoA dehydrogenase